MHFVLVISWLFGLVSSKLEIVTPTYNASDVIDLDAIRDVIDDKIVIKPLNVTRHKSKMGSTAFMHNIRKVPISRLVNRTLRFVVPTIEPPYVNYVNFSSAAERDMGYGPGVVIEIMKDLALSLNLTYEMINMTNAMWGNLANGTWSGAFGKLYRGEADMIAGAAIMQYDRSLISDLSYPFQWEQTGMLIRSPVAYADNTLLIVTEPFKWSVWGLTAASIFMSGLVLKGLTRALAISGEIQYSTLDSVWVFFSVFVQQGLPIQPTSWTARLLVAFWWLSSITLMATFTGSLVALFAVEKNNLPFTTAEGMVKAVKSGRYTLLMDVNTHTRTEMIAKSQLTIFKELWHEMKVNKRVKYVDGLEKGVQIVKNSDNFILLGPMVTLKFYAFIDCKLEIIPEGILPTYLSIPLQKNSPYSTFLSDRIRELGERGFINKWQTDYQTYWAAQRIVKCNTTTSSSREYLDLNRAQGAFWVLLTGLALAILALATEYLWRLFSKYILKTKSTENSHEERATTSRSSYQDSNHSTLRSIPSISESSYSPTTGTFSRRRNVLNLSLKLESLNSFPMSESGAELSRQNTVEDESSPIELQQRF